MVILTVQPVMEVVRQVVRQRQKLIAEAFYLTKDIEKYGSGFIGIRKEISEYPTMTFGYKEIGNGFLVELKYEKQKLTTKTGPQDTGNQKIWRVAVS